MKHLFRLALLALVLGSLSLVAQDAKPKKAKAKTDAKSPAAKSDSASGPAVATAPEKLKIAKEFKVDGYPTLIVLTPEGKKLGELSFDADAKQLVAELKKLAAAK